MSNKTIFTSIQKFVEDMNECYGDVNKPLSLYNHLLSLTTLEHEIVVGKHIEIFRNFCNENKTGIESKDISKFENIEIKYSDNVYINMEDLFLLADNNNKKVIWKHLLVLSLYLVDGTGAKDILVEDSKKKNSFINEIIDDVSTKLDLPTDENNLNVADVMQQMLASGAITDIFSKVQSEMASGNLDAQGLLQSAQGLMQQGGEGEGVDMNEMMQTVMSSMGGPAGMSNLMSAFMPPPQ